MPETLAGQKHEEQESRNNPHGLEIQIEVMVQKVLETWAHGKKAKVFKIFLDSRLVFREVQEKASERPRKHYPKRGRVLSLVAS